MTCQNWTASRGPAEPLAAGLVFFPEVLVVFREVLKLRHRQPERLRPPHRGAKYQPGRHDCEVRRVGEENVGIIGAFAVGAYIALAGLWGSPISGASMNPARTFGPDLASTTFTGYWVYLAGPLAGAAIAVVIAFILRGRGGDKAALGAAQGDLFTEGYGKS